MCGRYTLTYDIRTIAEAFGVAPSLETSPRYNIAPTQDVVTIMRNGTSHLEWLRWGLIPSWAKEEAIGSKMINARAETLAEKPSFKRLLHSKRCLVVADGFYEWMQQGGSKTPMYITLKSKEPFAMAGLWDSWKSPDGQQIRTCTIITTEPNDLVARIHNRMPAILARDVEAAWIDPELTEAPAVLDLLHPYPPEQMEAYAVSSLVSSARNEGPELILPANR